MLKPLSLIITILILFSSCRKEISDTYHGDLIGSWVSDSGVQMSINEEGYGYYDGVYSRKVFVKKNRDKLIFSGAFNARTTNGKTIFFIEIHPEVVYDTVVFNGMMILPNETYIKLIDKNFDEVYFKKI